MADREYDGRGVVGVTFAAFMLVLIGIFEALDGLAAIIKDQFVVPAPNYWITLDVSAWGWIHLILGVVLIFAAFALFRGTTWSRIVGILAAIVTAVANFAYIPYYPIWSIIVIALCVWVIWSLAAYGAALRDNA